MKERPNEWAVILVFLGRGQSFVRPSEDVEKIEMALERKKVPHPWFICTKKLYYTLQERENPKNNKATLNDELQNQNQPLKEEKVLKSQVKVRERSVFIYLKVQMSDSFRSFPT